MYNLIRWCAHPKLAELITTCELLPVLREPRRLVDLPQSYSTLVKKAAEFQCPQHIGDEDFVADEGQAAMLCLVCGEMLCTNSFCCQKGISMRGGESCRLGGFNQHAQRYVCLCVLCMRVQALYQCGCVIGLVGGTLVKWACHSCFFCFFACLLAPHCSGLYCLSVWIFIYYTTLTYACEYTSVLICGWFYVCACGMIMWCDVVLPLGVVLVWEWHCGYWNPMWYC